MLNDPNLAAASQIVPNVDSAADLPRDERRSAQKIATFVREQYEKGQQIRRRRAIAWVHVKSIMRGYHYYTVKGGVWRQDPIDPTGRRIQAVYPIMEPEYKKELGSLNSNDIGVTAMPKTGRGENAFYHAERAQAIMDTWIEEAGIPEVADDGNQNLLYYGMIAQYRYQDLFQRQVFVKNIPGPEIFPIPYDARSPEESDGFIRAQVVSRSWLEEQDDVMRMMSQKTGQPFRPMAMKARSVSMQLTTSSVGLAAYDQIGGTMDGAMTLTVWMKPTPQSPHGQWMFLVEEELYRYRAGPNDNPQTRALFKGKIPLEFIYYTKKPDDFWGTGFCEQLIAPQKEANRQLSDIVRSARFNKPLNVYNENNIDFNKIQGDDTVWVPFKSAGLEREAPPLHHFAPTPMNRDVGAALNIAREAALAAANHDSPILSGQQSGRTDSGPATRMLDANARAPLQPVLDRTYRAWKRTYPMVLDMLAETWPQQKTVHAAGIHNLGRELMVSREQFPPSSDVLLEPTPLMPNGRNAMVELLFNLRQLPSDDGKGFEIKSRELRRSLNAMGYTLPGIDVADPEEQRIMYRIQLLINDTQKPSIEPAGPGTPELNLENHEKAIEILRATILEPAFRFYGRAVQQALMQEITFHRDMLEPIHPQKFDNDLEDMDAMSQEHYLAAAENDLGDLSGQMTIGGVPIGM